MNVWKDFFANLLRTHKTRKKERKGSFKFEMPLILLLWRRRVKDKLGLSFLCRIWSGKLEPVWKEQTVKRKSPSSLFLPECANSKHVVRAFLPSPNLAGERCGKEIRKEKESRHTHTALSISPLFSQRRQRENFLKGRRGSLHREGTLKKRGEVGYIGRKFDIVCIISCVYRHIAIFLI